MLLQNFLNENIIGQDFVIFSFSDFIMKAIKIQEIQDKNCPLKHIFMWPIYL